MISVADARQRILEAMPLVATERVALTNALGRVLATDVTARTDQPPSAVSAMDGYAVRSADVQATPCDLVVIGEAPAGRPFDGSVETGETVRIFTGAPLPDGTDSVVIQENTEPVQSGAIRVLNGVACGKHVRGRGIDFREGDPLVTAGSLLTARDVGLSAAADWPWLSVRRRPRVALLATGDEIVLPGEARRSGQIVSSNTFALESMIRAVGGDAVDLSLVPDDPAALRAAIDGVRSFDLLVTTGGVSVGAYDLVGQALQSAGLNRHFWKIAMRPGKPLLFGTLPEGPPVLGFPGNPVSTYVCGLVFLLPALRTMLGLDPGPRLVQAELGRDLPANDVREDYLRATTRRDDSGSITVHPFELQDSSVLSLLARAGCLVIRPPHAPAARAGTHVTTLPFPAAAGST
ncbi:MAG: molybdopterin molybdotransferase MoeA [Rhodospirillales bacterium]|nr:molybdopterin molybdotransferase MoeA [Rhodospirillales bacterium]MCY4003769.1 molybdopterin molybdotransferase MoeA [Rhodospirillales bacterium]MDE0374176.1 molybdopterin molybdotransferase MoeA [Rhodospirillales bacterium]MXX22418.1 molybdopterin molybdotransferase MoeA [Rhodospirillales bacterium]MYE20045.1 molybdopterin molybdotransferase MoeA [Rhodospirillales bacterium]